jgi:hypothetical protein
MRALAGGGPTVVAVTTVKTASNTQLVRVAAGVCSVFPTGAASHI